MAPDGEELDAYLLGVFEQVEHFEGGYPFARDRKFRRRLVVTTQGVQAPKKLLASLLLCPARTDTLEGQCIAVIHRLDDEDDKMAHQPTNPLTHHSTNSPTQHYA
jgi:hypothetical protein